MRIHLVAIGGSVMHNLALDLAAAGHEVTGSDDELYEPSHTRLREAGLLPAQTGWDSSRIDQNLDCVIAGMHAKRGNPEIDRALELGIRIYSFPEFYGAHCRGKVRIVVAGSHGKTTTTAMLMHGLRKAGRDFDYLVGASLEGFERNVRLSDAPLCVIEGDEYPSSPLDLRPKIMHYDPDIAIVTGIAWDHMNVFPTWESYVQVFRDFIAGMRAGTRLIWYEGDEVLAGVVSEVGQHLQTIEYREVEEIEAAAHQGPSPASGIGEFGQAGKIPDSSGRLDLSAGEVTHQESTILDLGKEDGADQGLPEVFGGHSLWRRPQLKSTILDLGEETAAHQGPAPASVFGEFGQAAKIPDLSGRPDLATRTLISDSQGHQYTLKIFGNHNLQNLSAACLACREIGIDEQTFFSAMKDFTGAAMRLELMHSGEHLVIYRDFAHAPSKVRATVQAVRDRYPRHLLVTCLELHTFSSLNREFLPQYAGSLDRADHAMVFFSPGTLEIKKLPPVSISDITDAFGHASLEVATALATLEERLSSFTSASTGTVLLLMSSGRFAGLDLAKIIDAECSADVS